MPNIKKNTELLIEAAKCGDAVEVKRLIPVSDPKALNSLALRWAAANAHTPCVALLIPVSEPLVALKHLQKEFPDDYDIWGQLQQRIEAEQLHTVLHKEIGEVTGIKSQRKM